MPLIFLIWFNLFFTQLFFHLITGFLLEALISIRVRVLDEFHLCFPRPMFCRMGLGGGGVLSFFFFRFSLCFGAKIELYDYLPTSPLQELYLSLLEC